MYVIAIDTEKHRQLILRKEIFKKENISKNLHSKIEIIFIKKNIFNRDYV